MSGIHRLLRQVGYHGTTEDPVRTFLYHLVRLPSPRRARTLARDFYHLVALTGSPAVHGDTATFVAYAPRARSVCVAGEFNGWGADADPLLRVGASGLFVLRRPVPHRALYKLVIDGRWKEDAASPRSQPDGFGGRNSCLETGHAARLVSHPDFYSKALRNRRPVVFYLPPGYHASMERYPVVYIMDGRENLERGQLPGLFDAEIRSGRLPPLMAVFVPHRGRSRDHEYTPYFRRSRLDAFHRFITEELVPFVDSTFRTRQERDARVLLGQSFGGTLVTTLAARAPHLFRHVLAQSGVYVWGRRHITPLYAQGGFRDLRLYLDGVANRTEQFQNHHMVQALKAGGYPHFYRALPSRHEYEDWRERVPDGLRYLWFGITPE